MSVDGPSASDVYAVGADKGEGPLVLHFDGTGWTKLPTGEHGDLWWVHAFPDGSALMGGARATVLRFKGGRFERLHNDGLARQTVYGVWGVSPADFYAVGSASGRDGFVWHYTGGQFHDQRLPDDLPMVALGEPPGFFKVWGHDEDVWVVGSGGTILHRHGEGPFARVPTKVKDILFTVHGTQKRWVVVGGGSSGVALESTPDGARDVSPAGSALLQGVYASDADGDWASGERGMIYHSRTARGSSVRRRAALPRAPDGRRERGSASTRGSSRVSW
jgi:hypothetical protein